MLNKIASKPEKSLGRLFKEDYDSLNPCFIRDRNRIINSAAFRRLAYKTQVFVNHEGDHYRTRLTHSLEVAQIARTIATSLGICENLTETLALSHDLGHPPFGHAGEEALNSVMQEFGGFDHNAQTLRIITSLEKRYASFDGLNLTWETIEGITKHNGPLIGKYASKNEKIHSIILEYNKIHDLSLDKFPSIEAQVASLSDDIAYNNHDLEDGCRAGLIAIDELYEIELLGDTLREVEKTYGPLPIQRLIFETIRRIKDLMILDLIKTTVKKVQDYNIETIQDVRNCKTMIVGMSDEFERYNQQIKAMLYSKVYNHYKVNKMTNKAKRVVKELFVILMNDSDCLPTEWRLLIANTKNEQLKANIICDYIAGMTDRFVVREYQSFFDLSQNRAHIY